MERGTLWFAVFLHENPHKWLASQKICSVEKLETPPAGAKPKDITPSIAWGGEAWKEEAPDDLPLHEWTREGRRPSDKTLAMFQRQRRGHF